MSVCCSTRVHKRSYYSHVILTMTWFFYFKCFAGFRLKRPQLDTELLPSWFYNKTFRDSRVKANKRTTNRSIHPPRRTTTMAVISTSDIPEHAGVWSKTLARWDRDHSQQARLVQGWLPCLDKSLKIFRKNVFSFFFSPHVSLLSKMSESLHISRTYVRTDWFPSHECYLSSSKYEMKWVLQEQINVLHRDIVISTLLSHSQELNNYYWLSENNCNRMGGRRGLVIHDCKGKWWKIL